MDRGDLVRVWCINSQGDIHGGKGWNAVAIVLEYKKEIDEQNEENLKVLKNKIEKTQEIFIFGSYVDNIHTVNKSKIFTLHHGAIQEIHKEQQIDKAEIAELKTKNTALENKVSDLKSELQEMKTIVNALKLHLGL